MLIVMRNDAADEHIEAVSEFVRGMGYTPQPVPGIQRTNICVLGKKTRVDSIYIEMMDGVKEVIHVSKPYKLVSRESKESSVIRGEDTKFGADGLIVEVHQNPAEAFSDGTQSLKPEKFAQLIKGIRDIAVSAGRCV